MRLVAGARLALRGRDGWEGTTGRRASHPRRERARRPPPEGDAGSTLDFVGHRSTKSTVGGRTARKVAPWPPPPAHSAPRQRAGWAFSRGVRGKEARMTTKIRRVRRIG